MVGHLPIIFNYRSYLAMQVVTTSQLIHQRRVPIIGELAVKLLANRLRHQRMLECIVANCNLKHQRGQIAAIVLNISLLL